MAANNGGNPATHFGRQMRKERLAHGWTLRELAARTGISFTHLSRIETGHRPPTEAVAIACDRVFPERKGYFLEYYEESRTWMPAGFRDWPELEDKATRLHTWTPGILDGLLQTEGYARALIAVQPAVTEEILSARLASRAGRQRRVLLREDPPFVCCVVDHTALYRCIGSPEVMSAQMDRLLEVAAMPNVTLQVLPAVTHPATQSGFMVTDSAAYAEHVIGGFTYTEDETVTRLERLFDTLRAECYRASESAAIIRKAGEIWTGESRATAEATAVSASKSRRPKA
jgi:transcriptional regulator with XRE-family HTH domain